MKGKSYKVVVRANGHKITKRATTLELAREIEARLRVDIARGEYDLRKKKPAPTLGEVWEKYLPWAMHNKKTWYDDACYYQKHLEPRFGSKPLDDISPFDIEKLVLSMKTGSSNLKKPYSKATIKHQLQLLSRLYHMAEIWELYEGSNPCRKVSKPKLNNQKTEFLTDAELRRLLEVLEGWRDRMAAGIVKFALYTGLRRGEILGLLWTDVDLERRTVRLRDPKGGVDQTLPLSLKALSTLRELPKKYKSPWIFYGSKGVQRHDIRRVWNAIKKKAELPDDFRFHGLRHHFASALASGGVDLYTVQRLLTHKHAITTQRYAHLSDKALRKAVTLSESLLDPDFCEDKSIV